MRYAPTRWHGYASGSHSIDATIKRWTNLDLRPLTDSPVTKTGALGPMTSPYCRDPVGNLIEVASYRAPD